MSGRDFVSESRAAGKRLDASLRRMKLLHAYMGARRLPFNEWLAQFGDTLHLDKSARLSGGKDGE